MLEALARGDVENGVVELAPDVTLSHCAPVPWAGQYHGVAGFVDCLTTMAAHVEIEVLGFTVYDADEVAISRIEARFTNSATGAAVEFPVVEIYRSAGGRISSVEPFYQDPVALNTILNP